MTIYHVLSNDVGTILGVYGSAIVDRAREVGTEIAKSTGCAVALHSGCYGDSSARPRIGYSISMKGNLEWFR